MCGLAILSAVSFASVISNSSPQADIQHEMVRYGPENKYSGYLVRPVEKGCYPAMVVIHEWWGLNDNIKTQANKLAQAGYVALAVDLFGKTTTDAQLAMKMVQSLDQAAATAQLLAATAYLRAQPYVIVDKIGSIGWCFGGGQSLRLAINDPKLAAAVIYYGQPVTNPAELSKIKAPILGIYGEADEMIPPQKVREFDEALIQAGIRHEFHTYPGAGHAFANPSGGKHYNPEATADAWNKTLHFLSSTLKYAEK